MQSNTKLVLGGIAGLLAGVAIIGGLAACASEGRAPSPAERAVAPLPSPHLEPELATTHRPSVEPLPVAEEVPAPEPSYEPTLASGPVRVRRLVVSTGISGHEPTGVSDVFEVGAQRRVYAFVEAVNETGEPVALRVTFEPEEGETTGHVALEVPANVARFRTWAFTRNVYTAGRWTAVVRDPDGSVIAERPFDVE